MTLRPTLPFRYANPHIKQLTDGSVPPVKYQVLNCQGQDILVGRIKINTTTSNGHAFILRRFDTGAISLTTMFRAAFPTAPEADEKRETNWVRENYDLTGNNGSSKELSIVRLAGLWVSPDAALEIGKAYALGEVITSFINASPDPNANYRRSAKSQSSNTPKATPSTLAVVNTKAVFPSPTSTVTQPNPPKRRRGESPELAASPPRRSNRTKSPSLKAAASAFPTPRSPRSPSKIPRPSSRREDTAQITPAGSDETVVDEAGEKSFGDVASADLAEEDVAEQKSLIAKLKAERNATQSRLPEGTEEARIKRVWEEEDAPLAFDFKEPETGERAIATNRRVGFTLAPQQKSVAWGVAAFAVGLGAMTLLPNFF